MAFDRTDQADLQALSDEVRNDPIGMGYASVITQTNNLLKLLNDPANNVGGETTAEELTTALLLDVVDMADFDAPQVTDGERRFIESFFGRDLNENIDRWKVKIQNSFQSNSGTSIAIGNLVRPLSRAEVLFGEDTVLVREDWAAVLQAGL